MNRDNVLGVLKTLSRKRAFVKSEVMCNCLSKTLKKSVEISKISADIAADPSIIESVDNLTHYIAAENNAYQRGKKFECLNAGAMLNATSNSNYTALTNGSHDHGVDLIFESKKQTVFMQMKYRSKSKLSKSDALLLTNYMADTYEYYLGYSREEVIKAFLSPNENYKFVLVTNAKITKNAMHELNRHNWIVISENEVCDFLANPKSIMNKYNIAI